MRKPNFATAFALVAALATASAPASAALVWLEGFTIKTYGYDFDGSNTIVSVVVNESVNTGCAFGDAQRMFAYWNTSGLVFHQLTLSSLMAAKAQGHTIAIKIDDTACSPTLGRKMYGIRIM